MPAASGSESHRDGKLAGPKVECLHTAASANRNSHVADWAIVNGIDELVYASHKNLVFARHVGVSLLLKLHNESPVLTSPIT